MKRSKGFISMSIVYSFFLVFVTISALLLSNYTHNRLLHQEINEEIKNELSNIGNSKLARFTNLIQNGDMENSQYWNISDSSINFSQKNYVSPRQSIELAIPTSNRTVTLSQNLNKSLISNHYYYLRIEVFAPWLTDGTSSIIRLRNSSNGRTYNFNISTFNSTEGYRTWTTLSSIVQVSSTEVENNNWLFEIIETNKKGSSIYIDDIVLIDLTEALGTNIPTKEWLDENIPYFNGEGLFNRTYNNDHLTS